ncbi:MAG TPA: twin-arginine translocase TatA/TatE family subunit [Dehalococcoidia bacterium]
MELGLIIIAIVLLFGVSRVADLGAGLGKGIREFRKNVKEEEAEESAAGASAETPSAGASAETPSAGETVAAVKCSSCGSLNPVSAKHCSQCGTSLAAPVS